MLPALLMFESLVRSAGTLRSQGLLGVLLVAAGCGRDLTVQPSESGTNSVQRESDSPSSRRDTVTARETLIRFVDQARSAGVDATYHNGEEAGHASILESLGGGVAVFDYDADGDQDLCFAGGGDFGPAREIRGLPVRLFRSESSWKFTLATESAGLAVSRHYSHGVSVADYDHDGFGDLLISGYGGLQFFRNSGDGTFIEATGALGLHDDLWSTSTAWGDVNGDQHPDLYVAHYVNWSFENHPHCPGPQPETPEICSPRQFEPLPDILYVSGGDGTFLTGAPAAGLRQDGKGLGVVIADLDGDRHSDIYVANDTVPNFLYRNNGRGEFQEVGMPSGTALNDVGGADGSMGVAVGDFDVDGLPDIWVANYERESFALYRNEGKCLFRHVSRSVGVTAVGALFVGFGTVFFDADRDGDEDLFVANGHVIRYPENAPLRQEPVLFENLAGKRLENAASSAGPYLAAQHRGRGVAQCDFDDDGRIDLVVTHISEPHALLKNETESPGNWIRLRLIGTRSGRDAVGAQLTLVTSAGRQVRQIVGGGSYLSHSDLRPFWGIPVDADLQQIIIQWPSGTVQTLTGIAPNQTLTIIESRLTPTPDK